jgi:hypothetical protein
MDVSQSRIVRAFHNDPYNPTLFSPLSKSLEVSGEQERLIRELHMLGASDTRFAQKMSDAVLHILRAGAASTPLIESINPESQPVGTGVFTLTVTGSGFDETSTIYANGNPLTTVRVSDTNLTAEVDLTAVTEPTSYSVLVHQGGGIVSNNVAFEVTATELQSRARKEQEDKKFEVLKKDDDKFKKLEEDRVRIAKEEQERKDREFQENLNKIREDNKAIAEKKENK